MKSARDIDGSLLEFKDLFRLWPVMPLPGNLDPASMQRTFEDENKIYKGLDWELEDLLPKEFVDVFVAEEPRCALLAVDNPLGFFQGPYNVIALRVLKRIHGGFLHRFA